MIEKMLELLRALIAGTKDEKDEYTEAQQRRYNRWIHPVTTAGLLVALILSLRGDGVNKTQILVILDTVLVFDFCGFALAHCTWGTLHVADRFGGRAVMILGVATMGIHWSLNVPMRQYFGRGLLFWDAMLFGMVAFYLLCNYAYRSWYAYQARLDEAEDENRVAGIRKQWRGRTGITGILFALFLALPTCLNLSLFSDEVMEEAKVQVEAELEAKRTPEFQEYEALMERWWVEESESFIKVLRCPKEPMFFTEKPSYPDAGGLIIHTPTKEMQLLFTERDGKAELFQSLYFDREEPNEKRVKHLYGPDGWYNEEEYIVMTQRNTPGFFVDYDDYGRIEWNDGTASPEMAGQGAVTVTAEADGGKCYRFEYSEEYMESLYRTYKTIGMASGKDMEQYTEIRTDAQGNPVEFYQMDGHLPDGSKERVVNWYRSRFYSRDAETAEAMMEQMLAAGPSIPEEVLKVYREMPGEERQPSQ